MGKKLAVAAVSTILFVPAWASARTPEADTLMHRINALREEHDRHRLRWDNRLVIEATATAGRLVTDFSHSTNDTIQIDVKDWVTLGEAIGRDYDVDLLWERILRSDAHRSMLMRPRWDRIAIGVCRAPLNDQMGLYVAIWVYDEGR